MNACSRVFAGDIYGDHDVSCAGIIDMLLYSWDRGLDVCVDLTGSSPLTQTEMVDFVPGRAVIDVAQRNAPCTACSRVFAGDIYGDHDVSCAGIIGGARVIPQRHPLALGYRG
nr:hypothetical protein [Tanacetum cinerariifolium]